MTDWKNIIGEYFTLTITGSSHGGKIGGIIRNCPMDLKVEEDFIFNQVRRRKPKQYGTQRKEGDEVNFLSGFKNEITDGGEIIFEINNEDVRKQDYEDFKNFFRPSHADYTYFKKYGKDDLSFKDMASARMFLPVVVAGCFAKKILEREDISIDAKVIEVGGIDYLKHQLEVKNLMNILSAKGDTAGGKIKCVIKGVKAGLGEPIFEKISSNLAKQIMNIPSCCSFSIGETENRERLLGSEDIDNWNSDFTTKTNHCGGINAGITNGNPIIFTAGFHAIHTLKQQMTLISDKGEIIKRKIPGRHDISQIFRTPVIVESVAAMVLTDFILKYK
jgi:chorismate synthase